MLLNKTISIHLTPARQIESDKCRVVVSLSFFLILSSSSFSPSLSQMISLFLFLFHSLDFALSVILSLSFFSLILSLSRSEEQIFWVNERNWITFWNDWFIVSSVELSVSCRQMWFIGLQNVWFKSFQLISWQEEYGVFKTINNIFLTMPVWIVEFSGATTGHLPVRLVLGVGSVQGVLCFVSLTSAEEGCVGVLSTFLVLCLTE